MALEGGGKIKSKGGHSPTKPYEQRKSFFQRITDSVKDVMRPSWLGTDPTDASASPTRTVENSSAASRILKKEATVSKTLSSEHSPFSDKNATSPSPPRADKTAVLRQTPDHCPAPSPNSSGLWSVTPGDSSPLPCDEPCQMESTSSALARSAGPVGHMSNSSPYGHYDFSQLQRPPLHNVDSPRPHTPPSSLSYLRQRHLREHSDQGNNSSVSRGRPSEAVGAAMPSKRQKVWAPETSRKGRPLQPAVLNQPAFKMSVFCSSSLAESRSQSPSYPGRTSYGSASPHRKLMLNNSLSYQSSSPVRKSVTPKPVNKSGSAILSSSTTQIFKTLERLSDTKRARVDLRDSDSLLSFSPSSYRRMSRPLEGSFPSPSIEVQPLGDAIEASSQETVSIPAPEIRVPEVVRDIVPLSSTDSPVLEATQEVFVPPVARAPEVTPAVVVIDSAESWVPEVTSEVVVIDSAESRVPEVSPEVVVVAATESRVPKITAVTEDEVVISDDSSDDDDDVQIIESPSAATGRGKSPGSFSAGALTASQSFRPQQQMGRNNKLSHPVKNAQSPGQPSAGSPLMGGFGGSSSSSSPFTSPPAWGSTAPKPKSIMSGNSKTGTNNRKSVSFSNSKLDTSDSSAAPVTQLKSGSVMDVLGKSPEVSTSPLTSAGQLKQGGVMDGLDGTGSKSSSSPSVSSSEGLFAKFCAPAGSWECEVCMVNNAAEVTQCLACQAPKPGTGLKAAALPAVSSSEGLFAKFCAPAGSWECEVCMVNNAAEVTQCLACQAPKPGTGATGAATSTVSNGKPGSVALGSSGGLVFGFPSSAPTSTSSPFFPQPSASAGSFGGVQLGPSSSNASGSPAGFKPPAASETGGIKFGTPAPVSSSTGFKFGNSAPQSTNSSTSSGFTFGKPSTASSNTVPAPAGFQFGGKGFSHSSGAKDSGLTGGVSTQSGPLSSSGFQFGVSAVNCVSNQNISSSSLVGGHSVTASNSSSESDRTVFGIPNHCERKNSNAGNADDQRTSVEACDKGKTVPCTSVSPLFSASTTCHSVSASPSSSTGTANSVLQAPGCFQSNKAVNSVKSSDVCVFGSAGVSPKVTLNGSDSSLRQTSGLGTSAAHSGGFSFGGANKAEKSPSSQNGPAFSASGFAGSKGFVFGSPSALNSSPSASGAIAKPSLGTGGDEGSPSSAKSAINGEAGAVEKCAFGGSSATGGFSNASLFLQSATTDGLKSFTGGKQPSLLLAEEKEHVDNGTHAVDGAMPFKFASPAPATGFKFGQTSEKPESSSISQASGKQSGFGFSAPTNAASSKEVLTSQASLFGTGSGTTSTGQFSFSVGAGSQSNAAAAAPLTSDTAAPAKGFSFSSATPSSSKFGSGKSSNTSTPGFQFASPSADTTSTQSPSSGFTFGKPALSAKSSDAAPAPAAAAASFAPAPSPAQNSFSMGTGDGPRKLKRAVRRVPKN